MHDGIYEKLINKTLKSRLNELNENEYLINIESLDAAEAKSYLSNYISKVTESALMIVRDEGSSDKQTVLQQIRLCNEIIDVLSSHLNDREFRNLKLDEKGEILTAVYHKLNNVIAFQDKKVIRPETSISQNFLFTASHTEPSMLEELKREIVTSDEILWLVSFIKWTGIRNLIEELREFTESGGKLRVITTSYMEATDYKAVEELSKLSNTEIKASLNKQSTRLHAKAYLFKRKTGFSSAYIGSSNISNSALTAGLEWNMKVTERESFNIVQKFVATFESYWNDPEFVTLSNENANNWNLFKESLRPEISKEERATYFFDIRPYHYQQEILDELDAERKIHQRNKNLIVAATGVGKTVISAFDFKRYYDNNPKAKLLFVAHREEILKQSLYTFRMILKDENFGDLFVGQHKPEALNHLFISIQSWNSRSMDAITSKDYYDFIIVDEFHHAAALSYKRLLNYYKPDILLGLTATPERMDNESILHYFDDYIASEMRLKEAIDRNLLVPFHYYCVTDNVDLSGLKWTRKGYDTEQLSNLYTANDRRSELIIRSMKRYVTDIEEVKGLGFCVSVEHAKYMASYFNSKNIPSIALHGGSPREDRDHAQTKLKNGELTFIFVVDLYNEGVDIPEVNTILFLRPTESLTVFLQQLGRGLRLAENKECLTVLDFIGQAHKDYPFEEKFRALVGPTRKSIRDYVEHGFLHLPKGSVIQMEKQAKEYVLRNVKALRHHKQYLISKLKTFTIESNQELTLRNFLKFHHLSLAKFYGRSRNRTFERMKVEAGLVEDYSSKYEEMITRQIHKLFYLDSISLINFYLSYIKDNSEVIPTESHKRKIAMLYYSLFNAAPDKFGFTTMEEALADLFEEERLKSEIIEVLEVCKQNVHYVEKDNPFSFDIPLRVHAHYTTDQVMAAFGYYNDEKKPAFREGVKYFREYETDIFFITLNKSEKHFTPSTQYEDYAISDTLFHWQSQSQISQSSPTAKRYINHKRTNNKIALFVREYRQKDGFASPFVLLGTAEYVSHEGSRPVSFIWKLHEPLPAFLIPEAKKGIL